MPTNSSCKNRSPMFPTLVCMSKKCTFAVLQRLLLFSVFLYSSMSVCLDMSRHVLVCLYLMTSCFPRDIRWSRGACVHLGHPHGIRNLASLAGRKSKSYRVTHHKSRSNVKRNYTKTFSEYENAQ